MKRFFILAVAMFTANVTLAQSVMVVDSQRVFESLKEYTNAVKQIESMSEAYQAGVEAKFEAVENLFNNYAANKSSYSLAQAQRVENEILTKEREATEYQEQHFGEEGTIATRSKELMESIEERVKRAIDSYAKKNKVLLVLDSSSGAPILFQDASIDHTQQIINTLK